MCGWSEKGRNYDKGIPMEFIYSLLENIRIAIQTYRFLLSKCIDFDDN